MIPTLICAFCEKCFRLRIIWPPEAFTDWNSLARSIRRCISFFMHMYPPWCICFQSVNAEDFFWSLSFVAHIILISYNCISNFSFCFQCSPRKYLNAWCKYACLLQAKKLESLQQKEDPETQQELDVKIASGNIQDKQGCSWKC